MLVDGSTRVLGVVGDPIAQVRAPRIWTALLRHNAVNAVCVPMHVRPGDLPAFFEGVRTLAQPRRVDRHNTAQAGCPRPGRRAVGARGGNRSRKRRRLPQRRQNCRRPRRRRRVRGRAARLGPAPRGPTGADRRLGRDGLGDRLRRRRRRRQPGQRLGYRRRSCAGAGGAPGIGRSRGERRSERSCRV